MVFRGLDETPEESIVSFLAENREALEPLGTFLGASVFGIAATRPEEIAQDVPSMAREVDYISAMTYPSHWAPGEYGVANPNAQPYEIVRAALEDFQAAVSGTGARLVPWIQDFSLGVDYGPEEVRAQIRAAQDAGVNEFLLWDPEVTYTGGALRPRAKLPSTGTAPFEVKAVSPLVLEPNELGSVPVLMHHQVVPDGGGDFDLTPKEFSDELERLYREGYRPITASDYVTGEIELPAGTSPVVLTFDDAAANQAALLPNGEIDPETAVGIMVEFSERHPDFSPAATFYVNRAPFAAGERTDELVLWLAGHGFELANHTQDHLNLGELSPADAQQQIVLGNRVIRGLLPGAQVDDDRPPARRHAARPEPCARGVVGRRALCVSRRHAGGSGAGSVALRELVRPRCDPADPQLPVPLASERLRGLARPPRARAGPPVRLRRRPRQGRPFRASSPGALTSATRQQAGPTSPSASVSAQPGFARMRLIARNA